MCDDWISLNLVVLTSSSPPTPHTMSSKKDLFEPVSPVRASEQEIVNPSPSKKPKLGSPSNTSESSSSSIAPYTPKLKIVDPLPALAETVRPSPSLRDSSSSSKPVLATLKPLLIASAEPPTITKEEESKGPPVRDTELARWTPLAIATMPKKTSLSNTDDAIIRRKLMFEAGNPIASSHRGIKTLTANIFAFVSAVREQQTRRELEVLFEKVQMFLRCEELTLTRLTCCAESVRRNAETDARLPDELALAIEDVKNQIANQQKKLEQANKTEARFKEYLDMASSIRKLPSYEELLKSRNNLREETNKLKEEKDGLDRQQADKYPFLVIANWALHNVKFEGKKLDTSRTKARLAAASSREHSKKDSLRHKKSPKKSSKEARSNEK
ncbi:uncharacterized protein LOC129583530 [Paramacrobiotus metropolitanus]|uniref:uncharacterized protein LOC129583530 n=1 Tax=Paramacrobiotus metropolitanus TaxID=2943436 RepID=UPI0024459CB3|nr:uncharacterized protein LOC129583530 [Paramacrobiotus metropolitanus]